MSNNKKNLTLNNFPTELSNSGLNDDDLAKIVGGNTNGDEPPCCKTKGQPPVECQSLTGNYGPDCKLAPPPNCPRL